MTYQNDCCHAVTMFGQLPSAAAVAAAVAAALLPFMLAASIHTKQRILACFDQHLSCA